MKINDAEQQQICYTLWENRRIKTQLGQDQAAWETERNKQSQFVGK